MKSLRILGLATVLVGGVGPAALQAAVPPTPAPAALKPAAIFTDHMLLQRDQKVPVWGTATPGATVTVTFGAQRRTAVAETNGQWRVRLDPMPACDQPRDLILTAAGGGAPVIVADVLVGDIWLCSGQSNMAWDMASMLKKPAFGSNVVERLKQEIAGANDPGLRLYYPPRPPQHEGRKWFVCTPQSVLPCSAVGYYFAGEVRRAQQVPVGVITAAVAGNPIEPWITAEAFRGCPAFQAEAAAADPVIIDGREAQQFYDSYIRPWTTFPIRGVLWYQGESNILKGDTPARYAAKMELLIKSWRQAWGRADLPFYWVQLSAVGYGHGKDSKCTPETLPAFQDAQRRLLALPHTGMALTADVDDGRFGDMHPQNKWDVGRRLWRWAAWDTYGDNSIVPSGPLFKRLKVRRGGAAEVTFEHVGGGLVLRDNVPVSGFELRGADGVYHPATATIRGSAVVVRSPEVQRPVAVRYNWNDLAPRRLFNREGLPASPFSSEPGISDGKGKP